MFDRIFAAPVAGAGVPERLMVDSTHLKVHRTAASLLKKRLLHAVSDQPGFLARKVLAFTHGGSPRRPVTRMAAKQAASQHDVRTVEKVLGHVKEKCQSSARSRHRPDT